MMVQSAPVVDSLEIEDGLLILLEEQLVRLGPIGAAIVESAIDPIAAELLPELLVEQLGHPGDTDPGPVVAAAVDELLTLGVLVRCDDPATGARAGDV